MSRNLNLSSIQQRPKIPHNAEVRLRYPIHSFNHESSIYPNDRGEIHTVCDLRSFLGAFRGGRGRRDMSPTLGDLGGGGSPWLLISLIYGVELIDF